MSVKLIVIVLTLIVVGTFASPAQKSNYIEQENSCRQVCGLCDCDGFYCEDECICECNLKDDDNLRCIADMKKECDANGLEYEILMQETAKDRFLRQVRKSNPLEDMAKHLVILKTKRDDAAVAAPAPEPAADNNVAAPAPEASAPSEPTVAAQNPADDILGMPIAALTSLVGKGAIAGKTAMTAPKLLVLLREGIAKGNSAPTRAPIVLPRLLGSSATPPAFVLPTFPPTVAPRAVFPTLRPLVLQPSFLQ